MNSQEIEVLALITRLLTDGTVTKNNLVQKLSQASGVSVKDICGRSSKREVTLVRQGGYYLARMLFGMTTTDVGEYIGRDHSTVIYGIKHITRLLEEKKDDISLYLDQDAFQVRAAQAMPLLGVWGIISGGEEQWKGYSVQQNGGILPYRGEEQFFSWLGGVSPFGFYSGPRIIQQRSGGLMYHRGMSGNEQRKVLQNLERRIQGTSNETTELTAQPEGV